MLLRFQGKKPQIAPAYEEDLGVCPVKHRFSHDMKSDITPIMRMSQRSRTFLPVPRALDQGGSWDENGLLEYSDSEF